MSDESQKALIVEAMAKHWSAEAFETLHALITDHAAQRARIAELEHECSARLRAAALAYEKLGIVEGLAKAERRRVAELEGELALLRGRR